jgi:NADH-quinone oxidoreductase subunit M
MLNVGFFLAFAVKVPTYPLHLWLPAAHVEAPKLLSIYLAAILLKLGYYGLYRFNYLIFYEGLQWLYPMINVLALLSSIYASIIAYGLTDIKKIIAYSSVAHMNLGLLALIASASYHDTSDAYAYAYAYPYPNPNPMAEADSESDYCGNGNSTSTGTDIDVGISITSASVGMTSTNIYAGLLYTVAHGLVSSGLFYNVGIIYDRHHTRSLPYYRGLTLIYPLLMTFFGILLFSNIGFPLTAGFPCELLIFLQVFTSDALHNLMIFIVLVLGAVYNIILLHRIGFGKLSRHILVYNDVTRKDVHINLYLIIISTYIGTIGVGLISNLI